MNARRFSTTALTVSLLGIALASHAQTTQRPPAAVATDANPADRGTMGGAGQPQAFTGAHQLSGTVTEVDKTDGALAIRSDSGDTLRLRFPPPALASLEQGDRVTVQLALRADTGRMNDAIGAQGMQGDATGGR